jgi:hypothetical protein
MALCQHVKVKLPSRSQVRIPPAINDRYVAKFCKPKNLRSGAAAGNTETSDGPGTFAHGSDPFQQAVCNYNWDWMAATQRAMVDMHDSMQLLQLQARDPFGDHSMMTREQFLQNASWPVDRPMFGEGAGAGASGTGVSGGAEDDGDDDDDDDDDDLSHATPISCLSSSSVITAFDQAVPGVAWSVVSYGSCPADASNPLLVLSVNNFDCTAAALANAAVPQANATVRNDDSGGGESDDDDDDDDVDDDHDVVVDDG